MFLEVPASRFYRFPNLQVMIVKAPVYRQQIPNWVFGAAATDFRDACARLSSSSRFIPVRRGMGVRGK